MTPRASNVTAILTFASHGTWELVEVPDAEGSAPAAAAAAACLSRLRGGTDAAACFAAEAAVKTKRGVSLEQHQWLGVCTPAVPSPQYMPMCRSADSTVDYLLAM